MILAHLFERTMQKIVGIAPLIIALFLGTCFSSQAQIVTVQPINLDGGIKMIHEQFKYDIQSQNYGKEDRNSNCDTLQFSNLMMTNENLIKEFKLEYILCRNNNIEKTDLISGSYYRKLVSCYGNSGKTQKNLN